MILAIKKIWSWFKKRPNWQKYILFIFVGAVIAVLAVLYYLVIHPASRVLDEPADIAKREAEKLFGDENKRTEKKIEAIDKILKDEEKKVNKIDKEIEENAKGREKLYKDLDAADSFDAVNNIIHGMGRRRTT